MKIVLDEPYMRIGMAPVTMPHSRESRRWWFYLEGDVVQIIPRLDDGRFVINRQWKPGARAYVYEFPAGYIDAKDRSAMAAARRELKEETGYEAENMIRLGTCFVSPTNQPTRVHVFLAENPVLTECGKCDTADEVIDNLEVTREKLERLISTGKFSCLSSLASLHLLNSYLERRNKRKTGE